MLFEIILHVTSHLHRSSHLQTWRTWNIPRFWHLFIMSLYAVLRRWQDFPNKAW